MTRRTRTISTIATGMSLWLVGLALVAFMAGCATTSEQAPPEEPETSSTGSEFDDAAATEPMEETVVAETVELDISPVYFDFDKSAIRPDARATLDAAAAGLKAAPAAKVTLEGNCDERGSEEYNLALGERRAASVRKYLYNLGVPMSQMSIVSYGESRPAARGTGERIWQLNRRVEFDFGM